MKKTGKKNKKGGMLNGYSNQNEFIEELKSKMEQLQKKLDACKDELDSYKEKDPITIQVRTSEDDLKTIILKVNKNDNIYDSICKGLLTYNINCEKMSKVVIYFGGEPLEKNITFNEIIIDDGARLEVDLKKKIVFTDLWEPRQDNKRGYNQFMVNELKNLKKQVPNSNYKEKFKLASLRWYKKDSKFPAGSTR